MELKQIGRALSSCYKFFECKSQNMLQSQKSVFQTRTFAARKGYREMAKKKKVKVVIQKKQWVPNNLRNKDKTELASGVKRSLPEWRQQPTDDVWPIKYYAWKVYTVKDAIQLFRETNHPTLYNEPNAPLNLFIELNMKTARKTKCADKFQAMATLPHHFEQVGLKERTILAFCKTPEQKEEAMNAGVSLVGGVEIIKEIEKGKVVLPDFRFAIAHPSILPEMMTIRGILKKRFPNVKQGTLGPNIGELVTKFKNGVEYACLKNEQIPDFGWIEVCFGRLNMDIPLLEENFKALLKDINEHKPRRPGPFITRVEMRSPPSLERLKIDLLPYTEEDLASDDESSDDEETVKVKV